LVEELGVVAFPQTDQQFEERFRDASACWKYLEHIRWPAGPRCPRCDNGKILAMSPPYYRCNSSDCIDYDFTAVSETKFARSHLPLPIWFQAIWYYVNQEKSPSALDLQKALGLGSNRTALHVMKTLKEAIEASVRKPLSGSVDLDEFYLNLEKAAKAGIQVLILIAVQTGQNSKSSRIRLLRAADASRGRLSEAIGKLVRSGHEVATDALSAYGDLRSKGYRHTPIRDSADLGDNLLPKPKRVALLLQRWIDLQRRPLSDLKLDYCLSEFVFRFNPHNANPPGTLFQRLLKHAVNNIGKPIQDENWAMLREPLTSI
jgi:hypothetical protein